MDVCDINIRKEDESCCQALLRSALRWLRPGTGGAQAWEAADRPPQEAGTWETARLWVMERLPVWQQEAIKGTSCAGHKSRIQITATYTVISLTQRALFSSYVTVLKLSVPYSQYQNKFEKQMEEKNCWTIVTAFTHVNLALSRRKVLVTPGWFVSFKNP